MNIRTPQPTQAARLLKAFFSTQGINITHSQALEAVARLHGYQSWQAMNSDERFTDAPALKPISSNEYVLQPTGLAAWVQVEAINVSVTRTDEGVIVDMYKTGQENECLASAGLLFQDVLTEADLLDDGRRQMMEALEELGIEFGEFSMDDSQKLGHSWRAPTSEGEVLWPTLAEAVDDAWAEAAKDLRAKLDMADEDWAELPLTRQLELMKDLYAD